MSEKSAVLQAAIMTGMRGAGWRWKYSRYLLISPRGHDLLLISKLA
jgi:hypothetical protein